MATRNQTQTDIRTATGDDIGHVCLALLRTLQFSFPVTVWRTAWQFARYNSYRTKEIDRCRCPRRFR
jgi:hypothetical protein